MQNLVDIYHIRQVAALITQLILGGVFGTHILREGEVIASVIGVSFGTIRK